MPADEPVIDTRLIGQYRSAARALHYREGELEIDDNAQVSICDDEDGIQGAYVAAWIWVGADDLQRMKKRKELRAKNASAHP